MADKIRTKSLSPIEHAVYVCSRFLAYGLPLLYFLISSSFYLKTYDSAQVKITFVQIGATVLILVWLVKILLEGKFPFTRKDFVFVAPFLAYLASGLISYAHSPFKAWATEETLRRVFYMGLALITIAEFRSEERMRRLWRWLIAAAWVAIGYGMIQFLDSRFFQGGPGIDPFIWRQAFGHRVFSTYGNPNFYGNFLVIITPLILASILRNKGPLLRPFVVLGVTLGIMVVVEKMTRGLFGGYDESFQVVYGFLLLVLLALFWMSITWKLGRSGVVAMNLVLFALLFLNLYATETKGAWLGFTAAVAATVLLIIEYFLHLEERMVEGRRYAVFLGVLVALFAGLMTFMVQAFVVPLFTGQVTQIGFSILWIPTAAAGLVGVTTVLWALKRPWNLKKVIYGLLVFFVLAMGAGVLQFAKSRLTSVSFRIFTWISTWEMVREDPIFGHGVGTFKVIYPAYRRPQIIVLEGKSNTETDHAEDEYIEVWQDEGIVGFGIFLWLILTALFCGFKQLRWYSDLRSPDRVKKRKLLELESAPRSYEVLGITGAYIGALIHWSVDVSIRFVSSGIYSGLLPGLLVAYARNHDQPVTQEHRQPYERWIRLALAASWSAVFLFLGMELVPQAFIRGGETPKGLVVVFALLAGLLLFVLLEALDIGLAPEDDVPFEAQYGPVPPSGKHARFAGVAAAVLVTGWAVHHFGRHFQADVHHNLAIFFSKQQIWTKSPLFDAKALNLPPDIRKQYRKYGGALEHYKQVVKNNPAFPMAYYFTGNVYNDWGSQFLGQALEARARGDQSEAQRFREKALEAWAKADQAYDDTKALAPNYVQTHHQVGLLYVKRAEQARQWGDEAKAKEYYDKALEAFYKYKMLDPVFPPNYHRLVQIHLMRREFETAEELYKEGITYNDVVAKSIRPEGHPERVADLATSLAKIYYEHAASRVPNPFSPKQPEIDKALEAFRLATENDPKNAEAWKGLGFLLSRLGRQQEAQEALQKALTLNPKDPSIGHYEP